MAYNKTNWVDGVTPVSAQNMNHLETQYDEAKADLDAHKAEIASQDELGHIDLENFNPWRKIDKIVLEEVYQVDIGLLEDFTEIRIIGRNIAPVTTSATNITLRLNDLSSSLYNNVRIYGTNIYNVTNQTGFLISHTSRRLYFDYIIALGELNYKSIYGFVCNQDLADNQILYGTVAYTQTVSSINISSTKGMLGALEIWGR